MAGSDEDDEEEDYADDLIDDRDEEVVATASVPRMHQVSVH